MTFNTLFDRFERRAGLTRTLGMRIAHAVIFELGLVAMVVPVAAWWLNVSLVEALLLDLGIVLFFLPYTFCFKPRVRRAARSLDGTPGRGAGGLKSLGAGECRLSQVGRPPPPVSARRPTATRRRQPRPRRRRHRRAP